MYYSVDVILEKEDAVYFQTEFLNSLMPSEIPPLTLILKIGAPIILMKNLSQIKKLRSCSSA
jgi:hypothetical protein